MVPRTEVQGLTCSSANKAPSTRARHGSGNAGHCSHFPFLLLPQRPPGWMEALREEQVQSCCGKSPEPFPRCSWPFLQRLALACLASVRARVALWKDRLRLPALGSPCILPRTTCACPVPRGGPWERRWENQLVCGARSWSLGSVAFSEFR